jgi:hypothetical protein
MKGSPGLQPSVPRLIVNVASGPALGRKAVLAADGELRVGRAARAELSIADDSEMAGSHFVLRGGAEGYRLRDLGSVSGTWLDGERVEEAAVPHAAWVRAGSTELLLCHEGWAGAHAAPPEDTPELGEHKARALEQLRARSGPLYAVMDAARDGWVLQLMRESCDEMRCLFGPAEARSLFRVAPFAVRLSAQSTLLDHLVRLGWGQCWGVYLEYDRPFTRLLEHLRRLFDSTNPASGRPAYFRFYDPRVLREHLPPCSVAERARLFGDIRCFFAEGENGALRRFDREGEQATEHGSG